MVGNRALKRFLDRRLSSTAMPAPPLPEGRADHAPLEMLSTVALKQLRLTISQESESFPVFKNVPSSKVQPQSKGVHEGSSVLLSPVSADAFQALQLPPPHPSQKAPFGDLRLRRNFDKREQQQQVELRKLASASRSSSEQNEQSCNSSHADVAVASGRVMKPDSASNAQGSGKPRCQSSKFCHICK